MGAKDPPSLGASKLKREGFKSSIFLPKGREVGLICSVWVQAARNEDNR